MVIYEYTDIMMMKQSFWVTNLSNRNVTLSDLALNIKAMTTVNLLDMRHYCYTLEQLIKSANSGSLFNKRDKMAIRIYGPDLISKTVSFDRKSIIPTRQRSIFDMKEEHFEELDVSDEDFAKENADTADIDSNQQVIKG